MHEPIAYTYDADYHCPECALERFGRGDDGFIATLYTDGSMPVDSEGNEVGVVAPWDEWFEASDWRKQTLVCGTCFGVIAEREAVIDDFKDAAYNLGYEDGQSAADWYFDGRTTAETYAAVLRGIEDGDPAVYDTFPQNPLSGEWADGMTGTRVLADIGLAGEELEDWDVDELCDQYEDGFDVAVSRTIESAARAALA